MTAAAPDTLTATASAMPPKPATPRKRGATKLDPVACAYGLLAAEAPLYFTPQGAGFAEVTRDDGTTEQYPIQSAALRWWLTYRMWTLRHITLRPQEADAAISMAAGKAQAEGERQPVYVRVAPHPGTDGAFYLDPGPREDGRVLLVASWGWEYVSPPPDIKFWRPEGFLPLPDPTPYRGAATLAALRPFLNLGPDGEPETEDRFRLSVGWLLGALMSDGDYPILALSGAKGSGKTTTMRYLRSLLDPHEAIENSPPGDSKDFLLHAEQTWIPTFDNLRRVEPWLSDALCRLATGGAAVSRKYYTDDTLKLSRVHRPAIVNGIPDLARADDLLQRMVRVRLPGIGDDQRHLRRDLDARFEEARPRLLAALLDAAREALAEREAVAAEETHRPRLADWYIWVLAAARSLRVGFTADEFQATVWRSQEQARQAALEQNPVTAALLGWLAERPSRRWVGTMRALQVELTDWAVAQRINIHDRYVAWPTTAQAMTQRLEAAESDLAGEGVTIERHPRQKRERRLTLTYAPPLAPAAA